MVTNTSCSGGNDSTLWHNVFRLGRTRFDSLIFSLKWRVFLSAAFFQTTLCARGSSDVFVPLSQFITTTLAGKTTAWRPWWQSWTWSRSCPLLSKRESWPSTATQVSGEQVCRTVGSVQSHLSVFVINLSIFYVIMAIMLFLFYNF